MIKNNCSKIILLWECELQGRIKAEGCNHIKTFYRIDIDELENFQDFEI